MIKQHDIEMSMGPYRSTCINNPATYTNQYSKHHYAYYDKHFTWEDSLNNQSQSFFY